MPDEKFAENLMRAVAAELHLLSGLIAAREVLADFLVEKLARPLKRGRRAGSARMR